MENSKLAALQAKRNELIKAIDSKQEELNRFDVSKHYSEETYIEEMREEYGTVNIMGYEHDAIGALYDIDNKIAERIRLLGEYEKESEEVFREYGIVLKRIEELS